MNHVFRASSTVHLYIILEVALVSNRFSDIQIATRTLLYRETAAMEDRLGFARINCLIIFSVLLCPDGRFYGRGCRQFVPWDAAKASQTRAKRPITQPSSRTSSPPDQVFHDVSIVKSFLRTLWFPPNFCSFYTKSWQKYSTFLFWSLIYFHFHGS